MNHLNCNEIQYQWACAAADAMNEKREFWTINFKRIFIGWSESKGN